MEEYVTGDYNGPSGTIVPMWQTKAHRSCNLQGQMGATKAVDLGIATRKYEADRGVCGRNLRKKGKFEAGDDHETKSEFDNLGMLIVKAAQCDDDKPHKFHVEHTKKVVEVVDLWIK